MATNTVPRNYKMLLTAAEDAKNGADQHATTIPLKQNDAGAISAEINTVRTLLADFKSAESAYRDAGAGLAAVDNKVKAFLVSAKGALVAALGSEWTPLFGEAGFSSHSLQLPVTPALRVEMLATLRDFFTRHPQLQDARDPVNVTAERAIALFTELDAARKAVNVAHSTKTRAKAAHDVAVRQMRRRLSGLNAELRQTLEPDAKEWYSFGLTPPVNPSVPGALESDPVIGIGDDKTQAEVSWGTAPRSTRYAIYVQIEGQDPDLVRVASVRDRSYVLRDLPQGKAIKIAVAGVNRAGQGPMSEVSSQQ